MLKVWFNVKLELSDCRNYWTKSARLDRSKIRFNQSKLVQIFFFFFLGRISNSAQARLTCRVLCFTPIIKGKNPNYVSMAFESYVLNLLWDLEVFTFIHTYRVVKIKIHVKNLIISSVAAKRTLKKIWNLWVESQSHK